VSGGRTSQPPVHPRISQAIRRAGEGLRQQSAGGRNGEVEGRVKPEPHLPRSKQVEGGLKMADPVLLPSPPDNPSETRKSFSEPAPLIDVLFDQLEYLVSHMDHGCPPGCPDCSRLEQIVKLLLLPFGAPKSPETRNSTAS
jgi:hypothetical protein